MNERRKGTEDRMNAFVWKLALAETVGKHGRALSHSSPHRFSRDTPDSSSALDDALPPDAVKACP